jgi:NAD(P)H-dependent flavin oxidoreductase YrpB (nitropropane dioxygenase family)
MGGGLAGPELAAGVAVAGGLGTLGLAPPAELREAIRQVRDAAPDRSVAVNLLMPFVRRKHVQACVESGIDVAVIAFGMDRTLLQWLSEHGVFVFVMVGTDEQARRAIACGTDALIAKGCEAGRCSLPAVSRPPTTPGPRWRQAPQAWWRGCGSC